MIVTQGTFSYLPPLDDAEIESQMRYALDQGWAISIEFTDDPHPRNVFWDMWGLPMFDLVHPSGVLDEIAACRQACPDSYVRVNAFDNAKGRETVVLSFLVQRPEEAGFRLERQHSAGRSTRYSLHPYEADRPHGERYA